LIFTTPEWKASPEIDQYAASMRHILRNHVWIKTWGAGYGLCGTKCTTLYHWRMD